MNDVLKQNHYIVVPQFISSDRALSFAYEFKNFASNANLAGDCQVERSQAYYNFKPFVKLLCEKVPQVSELSGVEALPICSYSRIYKYGSSLARHRDRPGCEISLTVNLGGDHSWDIGIQRADGRDTLVNLNPGDAILYLGTVADHWRDTFVGNEYTQVFLHYVNSKGPHSSEHREFINWIYHNL